MSETSSQSLPVASPFEDVRSRETFANGGELAGARRETRLAKAYAAHGPGLGRLAFLLTGDTGLAEDIVQEAFASAFGRYFHLRRRGALPAYLRRTVVNLAHKHFRRKKLEQAHNAAATDPPSRLEVETQPDIALREELWSALRTLPYRQRAALVLRFYEDLSEREMAQVLGCSAGTVKSLVHRGLRAMRSQLDQARAGAEETER